MCDLDPFCKIWLQILIGRVVTLIGNLFQCFSTDGMSKVIAWHYPIEYILVLNDGVENVYIESYFMPSTLYIIILLTLLRKKIEN